MASVGSLPFSVIVDVKKKTSQLFQGRYAHRLILLPLCSQRSGRRWKSLRVRAGATGSGRGEDGDEESSLDASIEKSKKVLDTQRKLLQQIAERRKLVSSIQDSVIYEEEDVPEKSQEKKDVLHRGSNGSTLSSSPVSTSAKKAVGHQNASISSSNYDLSNREDAEKTPIATDGSIDEGRRKMEKALLLMWLSPVQLVEVVIKFERGQ